MKKIGIVVNPISGGKLDKYGLIEKLRHRVAIVFPHTEVEVVFSEKPGHATQLAAVFARQQVDLCLALGGDGTMNEVATGLVHTSCPLGIIPLGSGNGLARHIGLSLDPLVALDQNLMGINLNMDAIQANGKYAFLNVGFGLEAQVAHSFANSKSRGFTQYVRSAVSEFLNWKGVKAEIVSDTFSFKGTLFNVNFANGSQYGNSAIIAPQASVADGNLDASIILPIPFWYSLILSFRLFQGQLKPSAFYKPWKCTRATIMFEKLTHFQIDGEPMPQVEQIELKILPGALKIRVPNSVKFI